MDMVRRGAVYPDVYLDKLHLFIN